MNIINRIARLFDKIEDYFIELYGLNNKNLGKKK
tara:strand:- start:644 stop:745 length:102 start_codon:yes stop_codon:yes gene_type:complete